MAATATDAGSKAPQVGLVLSGERVLLSWQDVLSALQASDGPPSELYRQFIEHNKDILTQTIPSFSRPDPLSKSRFESSVLPINVTSEEQQKQVDRIKADSLWLSDEQHLDEVQALRIVLLEWQNRAELRLNSGFADAELASLRDALGTEYAQTLQLVPGGPYSRADDIFETGDARKTRILQIYHRTQPAMLALVRESIQAGLQKPDTDRQDSRAVWTRLMSVEAQISLHDAVNETTSAIGAICQELSQQHEWKGIDVAFHDQIQNDYTTAKLQSIVGLLEILLLRTQNIEEAVTSEMMLEWLTSMTEHGFFAHFQSDIPPQQSAIDRIQVAAAYVTLALLRPVFAMEFMEDAAESDQPDIRGKEYFLDVDKIEDMHRLMMSAAMAANSCAGPATLSWGLIFFRIRLLAIQQKERREVRTVEKVIAAQDTPSRRVSVGSMGSLMSESLHENINLQIRPTQGIDDSLQFMMESAVRGSNVFDFLSTMASVAKTSSTLLQSFQLNILQELLAAARPTLGYTPDILNTQLTILSTVKDDATALTPFKPLLNFVAEPFLTENFLDVAASRFPYEALPFLRMVKALAKGGYDAFFSQEDGTHYITQRLRQMDGYSQLAVGGFEAFHTTQEDENANLVTLDQTVGILDQRPQRLLTASPESQTSLAIPEGTVGAVISDSMPPVVRWKHEYSALPLLGRWLQLQVKGELSSVLSPFEAPDYVAAAVIGLFGTLLSTMHARGIQQNTSEQASALSQDLIDEASTELDGDRTIINCVFDIVEQQLVSTRRFSPVTGCDLLIACVDFITILSKIQPMQTWPLLVKSSLFAAYGAKRTIYSIITAVEMPLQSYGLLESCVSLMHAVMDLTLKVSSKSGPAIGSRSRATLSQRPLSAAVLGLTETMYAAFEAMSGWTFSDQRQKQHILGGLSSAFSDLLYYVSGTGSAFNVDHSVTIAFRPAADFLLSALSGTGIQSLGSGPIALNLVTSTLGIVPDIFSPDAAAHLKSVVMLARTHLGCSRISGHALKEVNTTLINLFPIFVRLPIMHAPLFRPSLAIETDVYDAFAQGSRPHLLGHLGSVSCLAFLDSLKYLNARAYEEAHISWRLISRLVTPDQQWTAIVLITGSPPGRDRKDGEKPHTRGKPLMVQAIDKLVKIDELHATVAVAMLRLLQEAQQGWPAVTDTITERDDLFPALIKYCCSKSSHSGNDLAQAQHNQIVAGVTDLSVISLHAMMVFRNEKKFARFIPFLKWLAENAIEVDAYNTSLHSNLKKNFAMKYDGLDIDVVTRTGILRVPYSENYFYDITFASKLLSHDRYWSNFQTELKLANVNLSIVESELALLRSFKYLCSEHGSFFAKNRDVQVIMAQIVTSCLRANMQPTPTEQIFDMLYQSRAEIASMLLAPLVTVKAHGSDFTSILRVAYDSGRYQNGSYHLAITNDDLTYWRTMVNNVRLALQFHVTSPVRTQALAGVNLESIDPAISLICDIAAHIIGEGLASVVAAIQEQAQTKTSTPEDGTTTIDVTDVNLLLHTLQTVLRIPTLPQFATHLSEVLIATDTAQSAMLLYSWSHVLLSADKEPMYALPSVTLLATLSRLPLMAEHLAVSGIFTRLLSSKMTQRLQSIPSGAGHLDRRSMGPLLYTLWSDGYLRIALNLLDSIGGGVAGEVSVFLNQFPQQLGRASRSLSAEVAEGGEGGITLGLASEVANLSLLSFILERFRMSGPSAAVDPGQLLPLDGFDEHKKAVAVDVGDVLAQKAEFRMRREVATSEVEAGWARQLVAKKGVGDGKQSILDQKVVKELQAASVCLVVESDEGA
ncbi:Nucleoporin [Cyphellophora attinorum]|uniref:Nucleoporin NUP188 n=1 Tax=Cyphellophora attinorum TaxID=1664694 RepID=A0A0N1H513_9EURO|nr:Nucleoporin [Phialophora attinorum]KPI35946.1 Nucleoporin [Phialophora attinorum]